MDCRASSNATFKLWIEIFLNLIIIIIGLGGHVATVNGGADYPGE